MEGRKGLENEVIEAGFQGSDFSFGQGCQALAMGRKWRWD